MTEIAPAIPLGQVKLLTERMSHPVQPTAIPEPNTLDDKRIAFPPAHGVSHERGIRILRQRPAIHEDLPVGRVLFEQHDNQARHLKDFEGKRKRIDTRHPDRHATRLRRKLAITLHPFFEKCVGRRTQQQIFRPEIFCHVEEVPWEDLVLDALWLALRVGCGPPDARKIRFPIPSPGRARRQVRFSILSPRNVGRRIIQPLCRDRSCCKERGQHDKRGVRFHDDSPVSGAYWWLYLNRRLAAGILAEQVWTRMRRTKSPRRLSAVSFLRGTQRTARLGAQNLPRMPTLSTFSEFSDGDGQRSKSGISTSLMCCLREARAKWF